MMTKLASDLASTATRNRSVISAVEKISKRLRDDPDFGPLREPFARYLDVYGDRFAGELKLEEPPLRENPQWVLSLIKARVGLHRGRGRALCRPPALLDRPR